TEALLEDVQYREECGEKVGLGFNLPMPKLVLFGLRGLQNEENVVAASRHLTPICRGKWEIVGRGHLNYRSLGTQPKALRLFNSLRELRLAPRARFELATLRLTAGGYKTLRAA